MRRSSLALRLAGTAMVASLVALLAAGLVISTLLRNFVEDTYGQTLDGTMLALMANVVEDEALGRPVLRLDGLDPRFEQPFSGWYWAISDAEGVLFRSGSLWSADLSRTAGGASGPRGEALYTRIRDFSVPGGTTPLEIVATAPRSAIDGDIDAVVRPLVIALVVLGLSLALSQLVQVWIGLKPLRRVSTNLGRVQRGEIEMLPAEPYREISPLIEQMNGLIVHDREVLRRAREHIGNLVHALKTPLAVIDTELGRPADTAGRDAAIADASRSMSRQIGHHLKRARTAATGGLVHASTPVAEVAGDLLTVFRGVYADRNIAFSVEIGPELVFAGERQDLEEMLGNLIDNACKWTRSSVRVSASATGKSQLAITVADDGAGMDAAQLRGAGTRGQRFDEATPGTGLGLAIAKDIAGLYGGALTLEAGAAGGLVACIVLPRR